MDTDQARALGIVRAALNEKAARYPDDADLASARIAELKLDSLEKMQLVLDLETALSVMADETEVATCRTIGDLVTLMLRSRATI